jgi:7,8-dihydroneopterin aldolase/epimerase/oxygenase
VTITVELYGLELFGYHGVDDHEQRDGQRFLFDVRLEVPETALSDRLEDAVDYVLVTDCVREVSEAQRYALLETLAHAVARELQARFPVDRVRVRVRKPEVQLPVEYSAATVELP